MHITYISRFWYSFRLWLLGGDE